MSDYVVADENLRMDAYYYGFDPTGVLVVDRVLSAVARAGKAYHHTESWNVSVRLWARSRATFTLSAGRLRSAIERHQLDGKFGGYDVELWKALS